MSWGGGREIFRDLMRGDIFRDLLGGGGGGGDIS